MKIGEEVYIHGYIDGIRKDVVIIRNDGGYFGTVESEINDCPQKNGQWIPSVDRWGDIVTTVDGYTCSDCGSFNTDKDNFCPNCGADMRGEEE